MGRFANSLELAKASWSVLRTDKELAVIPVVSFVCSTAVAAAVAGGVYLTLDVTTTSAGDQLDPTPVSYAVGVVGYLLITLVVTFFMGALVAGAMERFRGGDPTLGSAFSKASARFVPLFLWAMVTGTVGLILQTLEERAGFLGQLVLRGIGMAWRVVTWLAVPVIIDQGTGPFTSLKSSAGLFKKTWGENLIAQGGLSLLGFVAMLPGIALGIGLLLLAPLVGIVVLVVWIAAVSVVFASLNGIFRTAIYLYASGQDVPQFDREVLAGAFGPRTSRFR